MKVDVISAPAHESYRVIVNSGSLRRERWLIVQSNRFIVKLIPAIVSLGIILSINSNSILIYLYIMG